MKKNLLVLVVLVLSACNSQDSKYQESIRNFMETSAFPGVKTDLKIKFKSITVSDISVADSIDILQQMYEKELAKKIEAAQKLVTHCKNAVKKQQEKGNDIVAKALIGTFSQSLEQAKQELEKAKTWKPPYLDKYKGRNPSEILAKKATCEFSFQNPMLATRQEVNGVFILSSDGSSVYKALKSEK